MSNIPYFRGKNKHHRDLSVCLYSVEMVCSKACGPGQNNGQDRTGRRAVQYILSRNGNFPRSLSLALSLSFWPISGCVGCEDEVL